MSAIYTRESCVVDPRGSAARGVERADVHEKFRAITRDRLSPTAQDRVLEAIGQIDDRDGVVRLCELLSDPNG